MSVRGISVGNPFAERGFLVGRQYRFTGDSIPGPAARRLPGAGLLIVWLLLTGLLLAVLFPTSALEICVASETVALQDTVYRLPEILVEAERISEVDRLRNRPAFLTIVPMDDAGRRVSSAGDYLGQTVGCHVRSTGGYGAYSTASVRGSSAKQVRVFLDGIPLNQAQSGIIDLADLPTSSLSRIEVYRGFGPYDLSGSTIGGVINLVTRKPDAGGSGQISASYGSFSTQRYHGSYSFSRSSWDVLAIGTALSSKGDFEFLDDNATPYNPDDDEITERINNEIREYEALAKVSGPLWNGTLVASNQFYYRRQGLPGYGATQSRTERITKTYDLSHVSWRRRWATPFRSETALGFYYLYRQDHFEDRRPKKAGVRPDEKNRTTGIGASLRWMMPLPRWYQSLRGFVEIGREAFRPEEIFTGVQEGERQTRNTLVVTLEDEFYLLDGRLRLLPSGRYERYSDRTQPFQEIRRDMTTYNRNLIDTTVVSAELTGAVGLVASPGAGLSVKANYGHSHRMPALMEVFGYRGMTVPNPDLKPETGINSDIGVGWEMRSARDTYISAEFAYFWSDVDDLIMFVYVPFAQAAQAINIDSADIEGYECTVSFGSWHDLAFSANLTHLTAINTGPVSYTKGKHLPNRPETEAHTRLSWRHGRISAFYEFDYISGNYWNAYNGVAPNNKGPLFTTRRLHSAGMTVPAGMRRADFSLEVRNMTDEQYEDVMGYPLPGRSVVATLAVSL